MTFAIKAPSNVRYSSTFLIGSSFVPSPLIYSIFITSTILHESIRIGTTPFSINTSSTMFTSSLSKELVIRCNNATNHPKKIIPAFFEEMPKAFTSFCAVDTEQLLPSSSLLIVDLSTLLFAANSLIDHPFFVISSFNIATFTSIKSPPS